MLNQFLYRTDKQSTLDDWLSKPNAFTSSDFRQFADSRVCAINFGLGGRARCVRPVSCLRTGTRSFCGIPSGWRGSTKQLTSRGAKPRAASASSLACNPLRSSKTSDSVDTCYAAGQRVSQLCHNFRSVAADGAFEPRDAGISEFGAKVIERMNSLGMAVDLGHASDRTKLEACELSNTPLTGPTGYRSGPQPRLAPRIHRRGDPRAGETRWCHGYRLYCIHGQG